MEAITALFCWSNWVIQSRNDSNQCKIGRPLFQRDQKPNKVCDSSAYSLHSTVFCRYMIRQTVYPTSLWAYCQISSDRCYFLWILPNIGQPIEGESRNRKSIPSRYPKSSSALIVRGKLLDNAETMAPKAQRITSLFSHGNRKSLKGEFADSEKKKNNGAEMIRKSAFLIGSRQKSHATASSKTCIALSHSSYSPHIPPCLPRIMQFPPATSPSTLRLWLARLMGERGLRGSTEYREQGNRFRCPCPAPTSIHSRSQQPLE